MRLSGIRPAVAATFRSSPGRWAWGGAGALLVVAVVLAWLFWPTAGPPSVPRARVYRDVDVCLLTDNRGITGPPAAAAWAGLQQYSRATATRVSYVPVLGPATARNAGEFLASLVQRRCQVVVAVGSAPVAAVTTQSTRYPAVHFVIVRESGGPTPSGTSAASGAPATSGVAGSATSPAASRTSASLPANVALVRSARAGIATAVRAAVEHLANT